MQDASATWADEIDGKHLWRQRRGEALELGRRQIDGPCRLARVPRRRQGDGPSVGVGGSGLWRPWQMPMAGRPTTCMRSAALRPERRTKRYSATWSPLVRTAWKKINSSSKPYTSAASMVMHCSCMAHHFGTAQDARSHRFTEVDMHSAAQNLAAPEWLAMKGCSVLLGLS